MNELLATYRRLSDACDTSEQFAALRRAIYAILTPSQREEFGRLLCR